MARPARWRARCHWQRADRAVSSARHDRKRCAETRSHPRHPRRLRRRGRIQGGAGRRCVSDALSDRARPHWGQRHDRGRRQRAGEGGAVRTSVKEPGSGRLIGVGVGPGDPELLTLKAARMLAEADVVAHFAKAGNASNARRIVAQHLRPVVEELPLLYPVTTEAPTSAPAYREAIRDFYDESASAVARHLDHGRTVAVLSEGDPLFYGSYMHLHVRLAPRYRAEVVPGITAMSGCWSLAGAPIAQGDDVFVVLPATLSEAELERRFADADAAVVMKLGRHLEKVRRVLTRTGRLSRAIYVERGTTAEALTMRLEDKRAHDAPYFSVILVPGWETRP